jgi:2-keto-4-pentenoate hydratase/2-oxohepta-3-ene-1,7-dioic acid hydratase in catechol pathway
MRVVRFRTPGGTHIGIHLGTDVADLTAAEPGLPDDVPALLASGAWAALNDLLPKAPRLPSDDVTLVAPVGRPPKFLAIGLNYAAHVAESATPKPAHQLWFNKQSTCVIGPGEPIHVPRASAVVDYEGELAMVIGRRCRHVPADRAREVVAGYLVCNDVSVRDWQARTPTMTMGKSFDTHGPIGPWIVTADELDEPHGLRLRTWVSGDLRQDAKTDEMLFNCWEMIEHLTTAFTLEPGDVISTGTPSGVGIAMQPPGLLAAGDVVRIEIESIGVLENPVIDEPADTDFGLG